MQVVSEGGVYANGQVVVQPLPTALYGEDAQRTVPLRRLEKVLSEQELEEHSSKEMQKVRAGTCLVCCGSPKAHADVCTSCFC